MVKFINRFWEDLKRGENFDLVATVIVAIGGAVLSVIGVTSQYAITVMAAAFTLIAVNLLVSRHKLEDIYRKANMANFAQLHKEKPSSFKSELRESKEILMLGTILRGTTEDYFYTFKEQTAKGVKLRVVISNPEKINLSQFARQFTKAATPEQVHTNFGHTINQYKQIRETAKNPNCVQLKFIDCIPPFSLYIFLKTKDSGSVMYVELFGYKSTSGSIPKIRITEHDNPDWYRYFLSQFEVMEKDAEPADF